MFQVLFHILGIIKESNCHKNSLREVEERSPHFTDMQTQSRQITCLGLPAFGLESLPLNPGDWNPQSYVESPVCVPTSYRYKQLQNLSGK